MERRLAVSVVVAAVAVVVVVVVFVCSSMVVVVMVVLVFGWRIPRCCSSLVGILAIPLILNCIDYYLMK